MYFARAYALYKDSRFTEEDKLIERFKRRIGNIFFGHEIDRIAKYEEFPRKRGKNDVSQAIAKFAKQYKMKRRDVQKMYKSSKIYLQCVQSGGAGTLFTMKKTIS